MRRILSAFLLLSCVSVCLAQSQYVDLFMGQQGGSNCVIGPQLPHGSVNPSPQTRDGGHDGYKPGEPVRGFGQLHVSGTGWGRYGQILLSPQRGFNAEEDGHDSDITDEVATPYYYKCLLRRYNILCEVAPHHHSAAYRFTYQSLDGADEPTLLLDVAHSLSQHIVPEQHGEFLGGNIHYDFRNQMLCGYGTYKGGFGSAEPYKIYFAISSPHFNLQQAAIGAGQGNISRLFAQIKPITSDDKAKDLYVAVSLNSESNACQYLREECLGKGFGTLRDNAREAWNTALDKIQIQGTDEEKQLFYTSLYFSMVMPRDRSNDNPRFGGENIDDHYCIWDTWRTCYPLLTLIDEPFVSKTIRSFLLRYQNDGKCTPTFTSSLEWDWRQGGDDVENVIADAFVKGVGGFDRDEAYRWMKWSALNNRSKEYQLLGWQPEVDTLMLCSNAMEYAYNDFCVSEVAKMMGDKAFAKKMLRRSKSWQKLFNTSLKDSDADIYGFIQPRRENGQWCGDKQGGAFSPSKVYASWVEYFYEGNSWTYSLFTPHDFKSLIRLSGGKKKMVERLCYGFDHEHIALWNEPGFLSPFIFHHCDRPDLTSQYVGRLRQKNFSLDGGFCDNEDSGAMGSWYVFTGIGLFPNAGQDYYYLLPPAYSDITLRLSSGGTLHITREDTGSAVKAIYLNGKKLNGNTIKHSQIKNGGELHYK
ncbi:MAG: GH92 family glycosyl hydrolase [Prevotellaceae bacterium]|nr:GH92 family glycosyl hydrolase [Prevotellaceae bacterium]